MPKTLSHQQSEIQNLIMGKRHNPKCDSWIKKSMTIHKFVLWTGMLLIFVAPTMGVRAQQGCNRSEIAFHQETQNMMQSANSLAL